ncbi:phosphatidylethanolamine-binding protein [Xylariales sp. AK1849]|nr:phosphatidylethanolamine-binding protein [Xylariales sp. AK1849]
MARRFVTACVLLGPVSAAAADSAQQQVLASSGTITFASNVYDVQHELKKAEIIPTVIDEFLPSLILEAKWSSDDHSSLGNTLKVKKVQDEPTISLSQNPGSLSDLCNSNITYTITLTDPDAPSRDDPKWAEMCHFIATGITTSSSTGSGCTNVQLSGLRDIMPYKPPGPPPKTGKHRYIFLLFAPANGTSDPLNLTKPKDRQHWGTGKERHGVRDWAQANGLVPVAANFIYAQNKKQ